MIAHKHRPSVAPGSGLARSRLLELARPATERPGGRMPRLLSLLYPLGVLLYGLLAPLAGLILIAPLLLVISGTGPLLALGAANPDAALVITLAGSFTPILLAVWLWLRFIERRPFWTCGLERQGALARYLRGLAWGVGIFGAAVGLTALGGGLTFERTAVLPSPVALTGVVVVLLGWAVQGAAEEVLTRGLLLPVVGVRWGLLAGIVLSALIFAVLHLLNPNLSIIAVLNLLLFGLLTALYALREGGLWGVCALHSAWNWAQANLFGLAVSGGSIPASSLLDLQPAGPDWLSGGAFGPEGGLAVTVVLAVGIAALLGWPRSGASVDNS